MIDLCNCKEDDDKPSIGLLPSKGYSVDQLVGYIRRQLGEPTLKVELSNDQIKDVIGDALGHYSLFCPLEKVGGIRLYRNQHEYLKGVDVGQGVATVSFVKPYPIQADIFYGNLISPAPLFQTGMDEYDAFLRWKTTFERVLSIKPDWYYDEVRSLLYIHNPVETYSAAIKIMEVWKNTDKLTQQGAMWVKRYSLEGSRYLLGTIRSKFGGAIPSPLKDMSMDTSFRDSSKAAMEELLKELRTMQSAIPIMTDD